MRGEFAEEIDRIRGLRNVELIEKDIILHQLLLDLSKKNFFWENFLFKGGTCLIKHYLGYYRFSEDIDFTWADQKIFEGKSGKETRRHLSWTIDEVGRIFEEIANLRDFEFRCDKGEKRYVELGGSNRTFTFKLWYRSEITKRESFIKVQGNFVEDLLFPLKTGEIHGLLYGKDEKELKFLDSKLYEEYSSAPVIRLYDLSEILCEKVRAILTRGGIKARDFVDVYLILKEEKAELEEYEEEIIQKTRFMLQLYDRYRRNFSEKMKLLESGGFFEWGEERGLLISELNEEEFYDFVGKFQGFLKRVGAKISI